MKFRRNQTTGSPRLPVVCLSNGTHKAARLTIYSAFPIFLLLLTLPVAVASASVHILQYEAFIAGVRVGGATVEVQRDSNTYRISGSAAVVGTAHLFSAWHSDFRAKGRFRNGKPTLLRYSYVEQDRKKVRALTLGDGEVHQVKNEKVRPVGQILDGVDVLTAFFIDPSCQSDQLVHTGRYNYRINGHPSSVEGGCDVEVRDTDGWQRRVHVVFGDHAGIRVPLRMTTRRFPGGTIILKDQDTSVALARSGTHFLKH